MEQNKQVESLSSSLMVAAWVLGGLGILIQVVFLLSGASAQYQIVPFGGLVLLAGSLAIWQFAIVPQVRKLLDEQGQAASSLQEQLAIGVKAFSEERKKKQEAESQLYALRNQLAEERQNALIQVEQLREVLSAREKELEATAAIADKTTQRLQEYQFHLSENNKQLLAAKADIAYGQWRFEKFLDFTPYGFCYLELERPVSVHEEAELQIKNLYKQAKVQLCNQQMARMLGFDSPKAVVGLSLEDLFAHPYGKHAMSQMKQMLRGAYSFSDDEGLEVNKGDKLVRYLKNLSCVLENDQVKAIWYSRVNITTIREDMAASTLRERLYSGVLERQQAMVLLADQQAQVRYCTPAAAKWLAGEDNDAETDIFSLLDYIHPDDRLSASRSISKAALSNDTDTQIEIRIRDKSFRWRETQVHLRSNPAYQLLPSVVLTIRDITETNLQNQQAAQRELFLRTILNKIPNEVGVSDTKGEWIFSNDALNRMLGTAESWPDMLSQPQEAVLAAEWLQGTKAQAQWRLQHAAEGSHREYLASKQMLGMEEYGQAQIIHFQDITHILQERRSMQLMADKFKSMLDALPVAMLLCDTEGNIRMASTGTRQHLLCEPEKLIGKTLWEWTGFQPEHPLASAFQKALAQSGKTEYIDTWLQINDQPQWIESGIVNLTREASVGAMLLTLYRTHPLKAELDAVAQLCNELSLMLATTPHLLALSDLQGRVVYASRPLAQLCTQGDILPEILWPMLSEASQKKLKIQWPQLSGSGASAAELTLNAELLWHGKWQHFSILWQSSGQLAVWSLANVSELTDAQAGMVKFQQGLQEANRQIAQLETRLVGAASLVETGKLSVAALDSMQEPVGYLKTDLSRFKFIQHDLRAMLDKYGELSTAPVFEAKLKECIAMATMLNLKSLYEESEELLRNMEANTVHVQTLNQYLLHFAGALEAGQESAPISDVADQLLWLMSARLRRIKVKRSYPDEVLKVAAPDSVAQILFHLISNAIEACPPEGGHIGISISSEAGFKACVRISDNGQGMDDTTRKHLFEPLYTTKSPERHLGTGLFIARQLAEGLGAHITVEHTELARGSTFALHLPLYGSPSSLISAK